MSTPDNLRVIGKARRRIDGRAMVLGQTQFADDLSFPRMLHCRLVRSTVPHATIRAIHTGRALAAKGVKAILTGDHFPIPYGILPVSQDEHPLCRGRVRMVGDPVAAVIATTEEEAIEGALLVEVELEPLRTISDPLDALDHPEPRIHDYGDVGNVHKKVAMEFGEIDAALAGADRVFEDVFFYAGNTHLALEQHATVGLVEPDGKLCVWSSTQTPHYVHRALAKALEIPPHLIRVVACHNGGGFGGKSDPFNHEIVVAKAAMLTGRPVKICLTREEVFYCHRGRHPVLMRMKTGVKKDGTIVGMDLETLLDGGAYGSYGVASTFYTGALQTVTYAIPKYRFRGCRVFTNKPPCGPKRGHGTPQPRFGQEVQLDKIAVSLGIDPADLRLKQLAPANSFTANWMRIGTSGLRACIESVVERSGWRERRGRLGPGHGMGLAVSTYLSGAGLPIYWNDLPHSGVQLQFDRSGGVTAFCGAAEIGQGSDDVLAAMVAEVLGLTTHDIRVVTGDTSMTPVDLGSYSSRVTLMMGNAAIQAAERGRDLIASAVARKLDLPADRLVFAGGRVFDAQDPDKGVSFQDAVILGEALHGTLGTTGSYKPPPSPARYKGGGVGPSPAYSFTAAVVEVDVDPRTCWLEVTKVWIAHDIGRVLNPILARGQVEGSVYMGLGEALMEEQAMRRLPANLSGALVHKMPSMLEYKSPTTLEMPPVDTVFIEDPDPNGPYGAKEVGQGPLLPMPPAVANAVFDAVGVRVDETPITPEKIAKAIWERDHGRDPRCGPASFPSIDWPEASKVRTPAEGGDGTASNEKPRKSKLLASGFRLAPGSPGAKVEGVQS
ncbi:MAG: molybdopterin-dependent oxidoreductase [Candidatus Brocadiae bacterium]|nr:molybdopterin-dependent oxidoreductase [Candidatus Brocadiia bacterium]